MTKIKLKYSIGGPYETLYELELNRSHDQEPIITKHSHRPHKSSGKSSEAQKAQWGRFKQAVAYAKAAMAEPEVCAVYEKMAAIQHKRPFDLAVSDYFKGNDLLLKKWVSG